MAAVQYRQCRTVAGGKSSVSSKSGAPRELLSSIPRVRCRERAVSRRVLRMLERVDSRRFYEGLGFVASHLGFKKYL